MSIFIINNFHSLSPYTISCLHYGNKLSEAGAVHLWTFALYNCSLIFVRENSVKMIALFS